jgi:hypothetical protein
MTCRPDIEDLKLAIQQGRAAIQRYRKRLAAMIEAGEPEDVIALAKSRLAVIEEVHAEEAAELKRLTTN